VMYDSDGHDWGWGTWLGMGLMMTLLTAVVVAAVVLVVRAVTAPQQPTSVPRAASDGALQDSDAQRVLDERLARGDIDEHDYLTRRNLLRGQP
jgi:uncharacterized membrane protein